MFPTGIIFKTPWPLLRYSLLITALLLSSCTAMFFQPMKKLVRTPADVELSYEDVFIDNHTARLHGWWLPASTKTPAKGSVYFLHGNAENISTHLASVYWLPEQGYNVFLLDYRGYGQSTGVADIGPAISDIKAGWQWLNQQTKAKDKPIFMLGQSLGAALASYAVASDPELNQQLSGLILDAGFSSYSDIAKEVAASHWLTWLLQWPVAGLIDKHYDPKSIIADIAPTPLLIIHSKDDKVIPYHHAERLFALAKQPKQLLTTHGPHIASFHFKPYREALLKFLNQPKN